MSRRLNSQSTSNLLMVRPASFRLNDQTAVNNHFQRQDLNSGNIREQAIAEFDALASLLISQGISVHVIQDSLKPEKPDSLFPNNWISFHEGHLRITYPMFAPNRRLERHADLGLPDDSVSVTKSYAYAEDNGLYLEGTGSLVLDRTGRVAYAALSPRTHAEMVKLWCDDMKYKAVMFHAFHTVKGVRQPVYHTNVMLCIGSAFAVICDQSIDDPYERRVVIDSLLSSGRQVIYISEDQAAQFAGNMLEVRNNHDEVCIVMSDRAHQALDDNQRKMLAGFGKLVHAPLDCIETFGGGSARCMLAEIF